MTKVAIYCRLSEEDKNKLKSTDESESIQNQKSLLLEYSKNQGWDVFGIYCDESMSGADSTRPEFNKMIKECKNGNIDVVLCKTQSRFSRDIEIVEHYIHNKFTEWGVRFIGLLDHADTKDYRNKKSRQINGLVNEWYLEDLSENIKKTLRHKKENGIYTGSFAPYGYKKQNDKKGKLFVDEISAEVVKKIYSMYMSGAGYVKIAKTLNTLLIPCPSEYKRLCGSKFKTHTQKPTSKIWNESTVRSILTNRVYVGDLVQGKTETVSYKKKKRIKIPTEDLIITKNAHEPIIDEKIWNEVNKRVGTGRRVQKDNGKRHIFSGKIFCDECKSAMWKMSYKLKDGRYEYLKCKATKCSEHICQNKESIRFDKVKNLIENEIKKLLKMHYNPQKINTCEIIKKSYKNDNREEIFIKEKILKHNLNIKQLYKDKLDGIIESEVFCDIYKEIKEDISCLERRLADIQSEITKYDDTILEEYINNFCENIVVDEFVVSKLINSVFIGKEKDGKRKITVFWNL